MLIRTGPLRPATYFEKQLKKSWSKTISHKVSPAVQFPHLARAGTGRTPGIWWQHLERQLARPSQPLHISDYFYDGQLNQRSGHQSFLQLFKSLCASVYSIVNKLAIIISCNKMNINGLLIFIKFLVFGSINFDNGMAQLSHQTQLLRLGLFLTFYFALRTSWNLTSPHPTNGPCPGFKSGLNLTSLWHEDKVGKFNIRDETFLFDNKKLDHDITVKRKPDKHTKV